MSSGDAHVGNLEAGINSRVLADVESDVHSGAVQVEVTHSTEREVRSEGGDGSTVVIDGPHVHWVERTERCGMDDLNANLTCRDRAAVPLEQRPL